MITPIRILTALVCFSASAVTGTEPLTLSHVAYEETLTVVVDFDPDLHNSVVQSLEHFWKMQGNVQDVTVVSANDLSKRRHLAPGNIVLYGTFAMREDNPVFHAFRDTWIGDLLRKEAPHFSGDVGGLIVGKNPFSPGSSVVVVATSLDLLAQLHEHYDGSKSFIAVVDGRLESVMVYDAEFNGIDPGMGRLPHCLFRGLPTTKSLVGLLNVHSRYGLQTRRVLGRQADSAGWLGSNTCRVGLSPNGDPRLFTAH